MADHEQNPPAKAWELLRVLGAISQREVALAAGLDQQRLSEYELGKVSPAPEARLKLLGTLGFDPSQVRAAADLVASLPTARMPAAGVISSGLTGGRGARLAESVVADLLSGHKRQEHPARSLLVHLVALPETERTMLGRELRCLVRRDVLDLLFEESLAAVVHDASRAVELAALGVLVARRLPSPPAERARLLGAAWVYLANAIRVQGHPRRAAAAIRIASRFWRRGANGMAEPPLPEARFLAFEASLRRGLRQFKEANDLIERALLLAPGRADRTRLLLIKAKTLEEMGNPTAALASFKEAERISDDACPSRQLLILRTNFLFILCRLGRASEAAPLLPEVQTLAARLGNDLDLVRFRWLTGRVHFGCGRHEAAFGALNEVRSSFASRRMLQDTALVTQELAELYLKIGDNATARRLAAEVQTAQCPAPAASR